MNLLILSHACATPINQQPFAELQRRTGWDLTLVVPGNWVDEYGARLPADRLPGFDGRLIRVPAMRSGSVPLHVYRTRWGSRLRELRPDAIYSHNEPYALSTAQLYLANRRGPCVPFGFFSCQNLFKRYPPPFSSLERMVHRGSAFAFPITRRVERVVRQKGFRGRTELCPFGLDTELYRPEAADRLPAESRGLYTGEGPTIGYVGRLVQAKGLATLAEALGRLRDLPWRFVAIGEGEFRGGFERRLRHHGVADRCRLLGFVPHEQTPAHLAAMDVLTLPSETRRNWKEQFGRVIVEAMACGTPVVGSDSGEIPHLIDELGGGRVFPERDAHALADRLRPLLTDEPQRRRLADRGMAAVRATMSWPAIADRMAGTIERCVRECADGRLAPSALGGSRLESEPSEDAIRRGRTAANIH